jgi:hypothetical protein
MTVITFGYCQNLKWYALFGHIIRIYERYMSDLDASHSYVEVKEYPEANNVYRIESIFPKGKIHKNRNFKSKYLTVEEYSFVIYPSVSEVINWAKENIHGKRYSFSQNIFLGVVSLIAKIFNLNNWDLEKKEFNGRIYLNCTEAQIMMLAKFLNIVPTEGFDNFTVGEARDLVKSVWILKGSKNVNSPS